MSTLIKHAQHYFELAATTKCSFSLLHKSYVLDKYKEGQITTVSFGYCNSQSFYYFCVNIVTCQVHHALVKHVQSGSVFLNFK